MLQEGNGTSSDTDEACFADTSLLGCTDNLETNLLNYNCGDVSLTKQCFIDYKDFLSQAYTAYTSCCSAGVVYTYDRSCLYFNSQVGAFVDHRTEDIPMCFATSCDQTQAVSTMQTLYDINPDCNLLKIRDPSGTEVFVQSGGSVPKMAVITVVIASLVLILLLL